VLFTTVWTIGYNFTSLYIKWKINLVYLHNLQTNHKRKTLFNQISLLTSGNKNDTGQKVHFELTGDGIQQLEIYEENSKVN